MKFRIDPAIAQMFPDVKIGVLFAQGLTPCQSSAEIAALLRNAEEEIQKKYTLEQLASVPKITDWREAYRKFGFKPSSHRCSVEALLRRVLQGKQLPSINPIVDLYNFVSIKHLLPVGGDDIDKVDGGITLTIADGTEHFVLLGSEAPEKIVKGEVVYRDDKEVLCRSWNYRECEKSKITAQTQNVCLVIEGLSHTTKEEISSACTELKELLNTYCKGAIQLRYYTGTNTDGSIL